ncbi:Sperm motility kinase 2B [Fukomys damarensis]|uniref:non-specific serine/threonine protein kinase n=1 Tax=Fukomys damarensis TaxID=885580 RepID=A0A091CY24_FUKDA|nr:Sperm motility kinase 2B [Fukomys damarensis]
MGSRGRRDAVPSRGPGECSEGTSWLGLTTSRSSYQLQDNYEVLGLNGQGSFGKVFVGRHHGTCKRVAIKELKKAEGQAAYIATEIAILKDLLHPNITQLLEVTESKEKTHLVLEFVRGLNLGQELFQSKRQRLQEKDALRFFREILGAVHYCHRQGIVHEDFKPENVLINTYGRAKVCDFGFAFWFVPGQEVRAPGGTPAYFAPERLLYHTYEGPPLDVWALGVILYKMITGTRLFCGEPPEITDTIIYGIVCYPDFVSMNVKYLLGKIMKWSPKRRPTAQELVQHQWLQDVRPPSPPGLLPLPAKKAILIHMAGMGFGQLKVMDTLRRKEYNHHMATFLLLQSQALEEMGFRKVERTLREASQLSSQPGPAAARLTPQSERAAPSMASETVPATGPAVLSLDSQQGPAALNLAFEKGPAAPSLASDTVPAANSMY